MNIEKLIKLADLLDMHEEHAAAEEIDAYIRKCAEDYPEHPDAPDGDTEILPEDPTMKDVEDEEAPLPGEYESEQEETIEMPSESDMSGGDELKSTFERFLESPRRFENVHQLKQMIDDYVLSAVPKEASLKDVFAKLAGIADNLDTDGQPDAANMIDGFLDKYAADYPDDEPALGPGVQEEMGGLEEELEQFDAPEQQGQDTSEAANRIEDKIIDLRNELHQMSRYLPEELNAMSEELGETLDRYMLSIEEHMSKKEASMSSLLSKLGTDVERKEEADTEQSKRYDDRHHHNLQVREPKRDQERADKEHSVSTYKPHEGSLSTRYCPNHIGDQLSRVGPGSFQCSRDGEIFNWEMGYTTFDGVQVPGGSIAGQTPSETNYGGVPNRIFDSRDKVLNTVN